MSVYTILACVMKMQNVQILLEAFIVLAMKDSQAMDSDVTVRH